MPGYRLQKKCRNRRSLPNWRITGKKEEGKKGLMAMYDSDVHVADVLSYRYSANIQNLINFYQINVIDWIFTFTGKFAMD